MHTSPSFRHVFGQSAINSTNLSCFIFFAASSSLDKRNNCLFVWRSFVFHPSYFLLWVISPHLFSARSIFMSCLIWTRERFWRSQRVAEWIQTSASGCTVLAEDGSVMAHTREQWAKNQLIIPNSSIGWGIACKISLAHTRLVHHSVLWECWSWWGSSCNHLIHLVVMATQPEAWALGHRGGNAEREGCWEAWPSVWLPCLSFHASTNWTWHLKRGKKKQQFPQHWSSLWTNLWLSHPSFLLWFVYERHCHWSDLDVHHSIPYEALTP